VNISERLITDHTYSMLCSVTRWFLLICETNPLYFVL